MTKDFRDAFQETKQLLKKPCKSSPNKHPKRFAFFVYAFWYLRFKPFVGNYFRGSVSLSRPGAC